jgi:DNA-binding NarL/FixJ family response regulator
LKEGIITEQIRILLADDQKLFRESLGSLLEMRNPNLKVVAQASNGEECLQLAIDSMLISFAKLRRTFPG